METASAQESKYFCRVSTCLHRISRKVSISASFSRNLCPFWAGGEEDEDMQTEKKINIKDWKKNKKQKDVSLNQILQLSHWWLWFTLKEDVDVEDKALAAEVRDNMEPWRLRLVSEP